MMTSRREAMNPSTCEGARALLGWTVDDLARCSGITFLTIANFESGRRQPRYKTITALLRAFRNADVVFILDGDGCAAFRLVHDGDIPPAEPTVRDMRTAPRAA